MIQIIKTKDEFLGMRDKWNTLLSSMEEPCIFLTWEWVYTWWDFYFSGDSLCQLFIITVFNGGGQLIGILPAYLKKCRGPLRILYTKLKVLGSEAEAPDYLDIIAESTNKEIVLSSIFSHLKNPDVVIDFIEINDVRKSSPTIDLLLKISKEYKNYSKKLSASACPYLKVPADYEKYVSSLSTKFRFNLRRYTRILMEREGAKFHEVNRKEELPNAIEKLFSLHEKRWQDRKDDSVFSNVRRKSFHMKLAPVFYDSSYLRLFSLSVNSEVVASLYCFEYKNKIYYYQSGFEPDWSKKSVGVVLIGKIIEKCIDERKEEFDFLRGKEEYKLKWTGDVRNTYHLEVGLTPKGKFIFLYKNFIRYVKRKLKRSDALYWVYKKIHS